MDLINHYIDVLAHFQNGALIGTLAVIVEFIIRLVPTKTPLSFLYMIAPIAHGAARVLESIANVIDKLLPQNTK